MRRSQPASSSWRERVDPLDQRAARVEQRLGVGARLDRELTVRRVLEGRDTEPRQAALGEAEHVALAAQLEVAFRELEPVADLGDRLQPGLRHLVGAVRDEDAVRLDRPAADPAAQLVELGQPEPVGATR